MEIVVDWIACKGHGLCAELVPEHIRMDEWGFPIPAPGPVPVAAERRARRAITDCPVLALKEKRTA